MRIGCVAVRHRGTDYVALFVTGFSGIERSAVLIVGWCVVPLGKIWSLATLIVLRHFMRHIRFA